MRTSKRKGTIYERKIVNEFVELDPLYRVGLRCSGSANKGIHKLDCVLIDIRNKTIELVQAKDAKDWTPSRKIKHTGIMRQIFDGIYVVTSKYL